MMGGMLMELWTKEHLFTLVPATIIMIVISFVLKLLIGKKDIRIRMIPFQVLAVILFLIEIGKQIVSFDGGYDLYSLPFHFCSLFIFMLPLMAFYRGKYEHQVRVVTASICASVFLLMMIYPALIYSADNIKQYFTDYLSFHTVTFHNIVIFEFFLIVALGLAPAGEKGEQKAIIAFMTVFGAVAGIMAQILKTNYANMYSCNIPPLESVRLFMQGILGYALTQIIYVIIVATLQILFTLMAYWFYRLLCPIINKKSAA